MRMMHNLRSSWQLIENSAAVQERSLGVTTDTLKISVLKKLEKADRRRSALDLAYMCIWIECAT